MRRGVRFCLCTLAMLAVVCSAAALAPARTIELGPESWDAMAALEARAPRFSMAFEPVREDIERTTPHLYLRRGRSFLIRYRLDGIPESVRITKAELIVPVRRIHPEEVRLSAWRLATSWGPGVCHDYRQTLPEFEPWAAPGARGPGLDHALSPSDVLTIKDTGDHVINVTRDIEIWYSGAAENHGWQLRIDEPGQNFYAPSPLGRHGYYWRLRITYEPAE